MKTKKYFFLAMLFMATNASGQGLLPINIDMYPQGGDIYLCGNSVKIFTESCPSSDYWIVGGGASFDNQDTIIVSGNNTVVDIGFSCDGGGFPPPPLRHLRVHFNSVPPQGRDSTYTLCHESVNQILTTQQDVLTEYRWNNNGSYFFSYLQIYQFGSYYVAMKNGCGVDTSRWNLSYYNPNRVNLGPDQIICENLTPSPLQISVPDWDSTYWYIGSHEINTASINVFNTGNYAVYVHETNGCDSRDTVHVEVTIPKHAEMCYVGVDTTLIKNVIYWFVNPNETDITNFIIQKNILGIWTALATIPYTQGQYVDYNSDPQNSNDEYRIIALSGCGQATPSIIHRTVWLTMITHPQVNELQWQNYQGATIDYYIILGKQVGGGYITLDTVTACSNQGCLNHYNDSTNTHPPLESYLAVYRTQCWSNKYSGWAFSNPTDIVTGIAQTNRQSITIFPNPTSGIVNISGMKGNYTINIFNFSGQVILRTENTNHIDISTFSSGIYTFKITTNKDVFIKKVVKR